MSTIDYDKNFRITDDLFLEYGTSLHAHILGVSVNSEGASVDFISECGNRFSITFVEIKG